MYSGNHHDTSHHHHHHQNRSSSWSTSPTQAPTHYYTTGSMPIPAPIPPSYPSAYSAPSPSPNDAYRQIRYSSSPSADGQSHHDALRRQRGAECQRKSRDKKRTAIQLLLEYLGGFGIGSNAQGGHGAADDLAAVKEILEREFVGKMRRALTDDSRTRGEGIRFDSNDAKAICDNFWEMFGRMKQENRQLNYQLQYSVNPTTYNAHGSYN